MIDDVIAIIIFITIVGVFIYRFITSLLWENGRVPLTKPYDDHNLFEIFIAVAVVMIKTEKRDMFAKKKHLVQYVKIHFPESVSDFRLYYRESFRGQAINLKSACNWISRHIEDEGYKSQFLYFLTGIAYVDGRLHTNEEKKLSNICKYLKLPPSTLQSIINTYKEAFEKKYKEEEQARKRRAEAKQKTSTNYRKKRMAAILEVNENASFSDIKKAYRKLVKLHHPDRFQNNGPEQIKMARERFIEIQLAYEFFENLNK